MCAAMAGNAKVINNERQRDVKMRGWIARVYCCCCYTHSSGRIAKRNTDGRTDGQTDSSSTLLFRRAAAAAASEANAVVALSVSRSSLCYTLCYVLLYWTVCCRPIIDNIQIFARAIASRDHLLREERVWCHFWIASQAFGSHTLTQLS